jgi:TolA-binding protein
VPEAKITRLNEKIATLREEIQRLNGLNTLMMQTEDKQISLTDSHEMVLLILAVICISANAFAEDATPKAATSR